MKHLLLLFSLFIFFTVQEISAQQQHEFGVHISSINNFGVILKKQKSEQKWTRLRFVSSNIYLTLLENDNRLQFRVGTAYGWEKRHSISERVTFLHGLEPRLSILFEKRENRSANYQIAPAIGYVLGGQIRLKNQFYIYAEIIPALSSQFQLSDAINSTPINLSLGLNTSSASVGFV
ncbi:MAG: hypothetical protein AB8G22_18660 [Saprospiraceae bacterium]